MEYELNQSYADKRSTGMAVASLVLGIAGLVLGCCVYPAFIFGSLAIILAALSRGGERKMSGYATAGMILGIIAIAFAICMFVYAIITVLVSYGGWEGYLNEIDKLMNEMYPGGYPDMYSTF